MNSVLLDDNTNFIMELHRCFNKLFSGDVSSTIDKVSFAPTVRPWTPSNNNHVLH